MEDTEIIKSLERFIRAYGRTNIIFKNKLEEFLENLKEKVEYERNQTKKTSK